MLLKNRIALVLSIVILSVFLEACKLPSNNLAPSQKTYAEEMQNLVTKLSENAKSLKPNFAVIPQNGIELLEANNNLNYKKAIDGIAVTGYNFGYNTVDQANSTITINYFKKYLDATQLGTTPIFAIDYCNTSTNIASSIAKNTAQNSKLFIAINKNTNELPISTLPLLGENKNNIENVKDAKNFMLLADLGNYTKEEVFDFISKTNYDVVIIDAFYKNILLTEKEIKALKLKKNGGKRLVLAHLDIGMANLNKYYWQPSWKTTLPKFTNKEIGIDGNFRVNYWQADWQTILSGNENSLINNFIKIGFDGSYLTGIEHFMLYE